MGIDKKGVRFCDECGRGIVKAHKIHKSHEYCDTCYPRVFPSVPCTKCGASARPHRNDPQPPVCTACEIAERKCIRCEKSVPRAALVLDGKAVCPSCVPYFREPGACAHCKRETTRLSSVPSHGITEKVCESCRNKLTHATCAGCGKYRKVAQQSEQGACCVRCADNPYSEHACPDCGCAVPGSGKSRCRSCANLVAMTRELNLTAAIFRHEWVATLWTRFGTWLHDQNPAKPNLITVLRSHQIFFERIDAAFVSVLDMTQASLLEQFGTATLRTHLLPTRFLAEQLNIQISEEAKLQSAEQSRIDETLIAANRKPWGDLLRSYRKDMDAAELSLRSIRMYLATAHQFASYVGLAAAPWSCGQIERFLVEHSGARNNLSRFVSFCRSTQDWDVSMPPKGGVSLAPIKDPLVTSNKLAGLMKNVEEAGIENANRMTIQKILATALGISLNAIKALSANEFTSSKAGLSVSIQHEEIHLPEELIPYGQRLLRFLQ